MAAERETACWGSLLRTPESGDFAGESASRRGARTSELNVSARMRRQCVSRPWCMPACKTGISDHICYAGLLYIASSAWHARIHLSLALALYYGV